MAKRQLKDLRILVTGASAGIGWHLAMELAQQGAQLLLTARRREKLLDLETKIRQNIPSARVEHIAGDITEPSLRLQLCDYCEKHWGGLDVLVNNAGVGSLGPFRESTEATLREVMEVNFFAPVELARLALPLLQRGRTPAIVNISSVLAHRAVPYKSEYCASKFALHGFSDSLRAELASEAIDVVLVSPSTTDSEFFENSIVDTTDRDWKGRNPMPPEKVAQATARAIEKGSHEVILTLGGKSLVLMDRLVPTLANKAVQRWG